MIATLEYVEQKFNEFNELMFEGKLAKLPFKLSSARSFLGQIRCMRHKNPDGTWRYSDFQFIISTKIDLPESEVEDTIIHEMIHYYIFSNQMQDTGPHGQIFQRTMKEINMRFNRNISVVHKVTKEEEDQDVEVREHILCITRTRGNQMGITVVSKSKLATLWDAIPKFPRIAEAKWYVSRDPFFNRYPRVTTAKIYPIPRADLEAHMADLQPLEKVGNDFRVVKKS